MFLEGPRVCQRTCLNKQHNEDQGALRKSKVLKKYYKNISQTLNIPQDLEHLKKKKNKWNNRDSAYRRLSTKSH